MVAVPGNHFWWFSTLAATFVFFSSVHLAFFGAVALWILTLQFAQRLSFSNQAVEKLQNTLIFA